MPRKRVSPMILRQQAKQLAGQIEAGLDAKKALKKLTGLLERKGK